MPDNAKRTPKKRKKATTATGGFAKPRVFNFSKALNAEAQRVDTFAGQIGTTGLRRMGPYVVEEYLTELRGKQGRARYQEMYNTDVVRRALRAILLPMLQASWRVEGGAGADAERAREFVAQCMDDMSHTWREWLQDALIGTAVYGASWYQTIYKRRLGPNQRDAKKRSKFNDGLWGWRKFSPRYQNTWEGWEWDDDGDMKALIQSDPYSGRGKVVIPLDISLHFTLEGRLGNPEGESLLRAAYQPWYGYRHAEIWTGILIERMGGIPEFAVEDANLPLFSDDIPEMQNLRSYLEDAGTAFRLDEQTCIITPPGIKFNLHTPAVRVNDLIRYMQFCAWRIMGCLLAQFLELGQTPYGSYAKTESEKDFFLQSCQAMLQAIADVLNRYELPRLFKLNAGSFTQLEELPQLVPTDTRAPDLTTVAEPLARLVRAGVMEPYPALQAYLRQIGHLPEPDEEEEDGPTTRIEEEPNGEEEEAQHANEVANRT